MAVKYSRQRQLIYHFLTSRKDHPTADAIYQNVRQKHPNISLGTVYRNLTLLTERGEIQRLQVGDGMDHFDADTSCHCHFFCSKCNSLTDLQMDCMDDILEHARQNFDGRIDKQTTCFYGVCDSCLNETTAKKDQCAVSFIFSQMTQNEFSFCKAEEGVDAVASLTDDNTADENSSKLFGEM